jgi:hypothetical protein
MKQKKKEMIQDLMEELTGRFLHTHEVRGNDTTLEAFVWDNLVELFV